MRRARAIAARSIPIAKETTLKLRPGTAQPIRAMRALVAAAALLSASASLLAQALPTIAPARAGMSAERLDRLGTWLRSEVAAQHIPGAVVMVVRGGKVV